MDRIRVDTDELKAKSKAIETSAGVFAQAGKDILAYSATVPSYDGQLSTSARAAALEINRQCQAVHTSYISDSQSLSKTAQAFAEADSQIITGISNSSDQLAAGSAIGIFGLDIGGIPGVIGWIDDGKTIILWIGGLKMVLDKSKLTEEQLQYYADFKKAVGDVYDNLKSLLIAAGLDASAAIILLAAIIEATATSPADLFPAVGQGKAFVEFCIIVGSIIGLAAETADVVNDMYKLYCSISDLTTAWNNLATSGAAESIEKTY
jgi:uncharacterized protein YukE